MEFISQSEKETSQIAADVAATLKGGEILALKGDLGAGKTTFTKALAAALGVSESVTSPTFLIVKQYQIPSGRIKRLIHIDCYRLNGINDLESIGFPDFIDDKNAVIVVEWPENIWEAIEHKAKMIEFYHVKEDVRRIII